MKNYDKVKLINLKNEYEKLGLKLGDTGIVMGEEKNGYVLVYFYGNIYQDKDGVYKTTEIDAGILIEDLEIIK
ncbi:MAG: hypothetical protein IJ538_03505 [Clostridia bacterium]|nr:hypothetical protein [Clostridia bacterium]